VGREANAYLEIEVQNQEAEGKKWMQQMDEPMKQ